MQNGSDRTTWYEDWTIGALVVGGVLVFLFNAWVFFHLGFWRTIAIWWAGAWSAGKAMLLAAAAVGTVLLFIFVVTRLSRPARATVFISYPHEQLALASEVSAHIEAPDLRVRMIPFVDRPSEHDAVIFEAATNIRESDVLIVITAPVSSSSTPLIPRFYEAEIFAATVERKPVVLLGGQDEFSLPPTAYAGYPVFEVLAVRQRDFAPLTSLVHYAVGTRRTVTDLLWLLLEETFTNALTSGFAYLAFALPLSALYLGVIAVVTWLRGVEATVKLMSVVRTAGSILVWLVAFLAGLWVVIRRFRMELRLRKTFREDFAQRRMSNESLTALIGELGGKGIVESLMPASARAKAVES